MIRFTLCCLFVLIGFWACSSSKPSPYIKKVIPTPRVLPEVEQDYTGEVAILDSLLQVIHTKSSGLDFLPALSETVAVIFQGKRTHTAVIQDGSITLQRGAPQNLTPTLIVPISLPIARNLEASIEDGKLDDQEIFNWARVLLVPCLQRMMAMPYYYSPKISWSRLHDFLEIRIENPDGFTYHGENVDLVATVVNVDNMFLVSPDPAGDPDLRLAFSMDQARRLYKLGVYDYLRDKGTDRIKENIERYRALVDSAIVYERSWH